MLTSMFNKWTHNVVNRCITNWRVGSSIKKAIKNTPASKDTTLLDKLTVEREELVHEVENANHEIERLQGVEISLNSVLKVAQEEVNQMEEMVAVWQQKEAHRQMCLNCKNCPNCDKQKRKAESIKASSVTGWDIRGKLGMRGSIPANAPTAPSVTVAPPNVGKQTE